MGKIPIDWPQIIAELERQVVEGQHVQVKKSIHQFNPKHIPRNFVAPLAELAWRISEPLQTLKLLNKFIFPENELAIVPTDREKMIYATALANLGAVNEALQLFESIDPLKEPEVFLRKSMAHFRVWNYKAPISFLKEFLAQSDLPPYRRLIGQVNLAAALVTEGMYDEAETWLKDIQQQCQQNQYLLLLGNTLEMQAQIHFFRRNYSEALSLIDQSMALLQNQDGEFLLYAEKWKILCQAYRNRNEHSLEALKTFRAKALALNQMETVRDCDLFESVLTQNEELCRKVILGTPFENYRQRARRLFGKNIVPQGNFHLSLDLGESPIGDVFLFDPYQVQAGKESLHTKPQLLALFEALTLDFYKTSHIGLLFQRIYKDEKFNPFSSPDRVLSLMKRLDRWFVDQGVPLRVRMKKSEFGLMAHDATARPVQILIQRAKTLSKQEGHLSTLRDFFQGRTFSSQDISDKMNVSKATAQNLIGQAVKEGSVIKRGVGRGTTYALVPRNRKRAAA